MAVPTVTWDGTFEASPAGSDDPRAADDRIRELKQGTRQRKEREHGGATSEASARHGVHRAGSARGSYAASNPTTVPDGTSTRALSSTDDQGRLHVDSNKKSLRVYNGSAWEIVGLLNLKIIDIGDWNMDSTASVSIAHGLTLSKIRHLEASIRDDSDTMCTPLTYYGNGALYAGTVNVALQRLLSGYFDSATFDSTGFNRGWILIWYTD